MSKVVFKSKQKFLQVAHEELFHVGVVITRYRDGKWIGSQDEWEALQKLPDPDMVGGSYCFCSGEDHNELILEREDAITGMRAYISKRGDDLIVELNADGTAPEEPEGVIFECNTPFTQLYPAEYKGYTPAEGKTFSFVWGEKQNRYITSDPDEIKLLRAYIANRADNVFTEI